MGSRSSTKVCVCVLFLGLVGSMSAKAGQPQSPRQGETRGPRNLVVLGKANAADRPVLRVNADCDAATLPLLSWDTEGGGRAKRNLLRADVSLYRCNQGKSVQLTGKGEKRGTHEVSFRLAAAEKQIDWSVRAIHGGMTMQFSGGEGAKGDRLELVFPFDPRMAATTLLPARWDVDGTLKLPAVIAHRTSGKCFWRVVRATR